MSHQSSAVLQQVNRAIFRPEILAPAGNEEMMRAAVENGADAVYFGLQTFNARLRAANFSYEDLPRIMAWLHERGVKGYVTMNTLVFPSELEEAAKALRVCSDAGVDAVLIQDLGLALLANRYVPDLPVHASTQMTVTCAESVHALDALGFNIERVVAARELSRKELRRMRRDTDKEIEVFVHGAICVAYSGQCLTSEALGGRSANRGECAQACRLPYDLVVDGETHDLPGEIKYLLSPKDLAAYEDIGDLMDIGIVSLKIEGRLKSPQYVAATVQSYRAAVEQAASDLPVRMDPPTRRKLEMTFSRGFTGGYIHETNHQAVVEGRFPKKRGLFVGRVERLVRGGVVVRCEGPIKLGDGIVFDSNSPAEDEAGGRVYELFRDNTSVRSFDPLDEKKRGPVELTFRFGEGRVDLRRVRPGDLVWKTSDPALDAQLAASYQGDQIRYRRPVKATVFGRVGAPLVLELDDLEGTRVRAEDTAPADQALKHPLSREVLADQLGRLGNTPFVLMDLDVNLQGDLMVPMSRLNDLRRRAAEALVERRREKGKGRRVVEGVVEPLLSNCGLGVSPEHTDRREEPRTILVPSIQGPDPERLRVAWRYHLPHWEQDGSSYSVTFRLADSLPQETLEYYRQRKAEILNSAEREKRQLTSEEERILAKLFNEQISQPLDRGYGACWLARPEISEIVEEALRYFDGERYRLYAWCVMPNHVHVLLQPLNGHTLDSILHSWKSFTAHKANKLLRRTGEFWQSEYFDHLLRHELSFVRAVWYVWRNPDLAGLTGAIRRGVANGAEPVLHACQEVYSNNAGQFSADRKGYSLAELALLKLSRQIEQPTSPNQESNGVLGRDAQATIGIAAPSVPTLSALCRSLEQVQAAVRSGLVHTIYTDFEDIRLHREARELVPAGGPRFVPAGLRIVKPGEATFIRKLLEARPDAILVRNMASWQILRNEAPGLEMVGDYALNISNQITARLLKEQAGFSALTPSYDLNIDQLAELLEAAPPEWFEVTVHQYMPMFHMEHCVFCRFLSTGTDFTNCGRPCESHTVALRDRLGYEHAVKADAGCRNTVFNAVAQSASAYLERIMRAGVRRFRIDFLSEDAATVRQTLEAYHGAVTGSRDGGDLWKELRASSKLGVTRGSLDHE